MIRINSTARKNYGEGLIHGVLRPRAWIAAFKPSTIAVLGK